MKTAIATQLYLELLPRLINKICISAEDNMPYSKQY